MLTLWQLQLQKDVVLDEKQQPSTHSVHSLLHRDRGLVLTWSTERALWVLRSKVSNEIVICNCISRGWGEGRNWGEREGEGGERGRERECDLLGVRTS